MYLPSHGCNSPTWSIFWPNYSLTSWPESLWPVFQYFGQNIWGLFLLRGHSCGPRNSPTWSISWPNYFLTSWPLWPKFQKYVIIYNVIKFMFSKKATKIDKIFIVDLTLYSKRQIDGEDLVNFRGLLMNFIWPWSNSLTWSISWPESLRSKIMRSFLTTRALSRPKEFVWWCR